MADTILVSNRFIHPGSLFLEMLAGGQQHVELVVVYTYVVLESLLQFMEMAIEFWSAIRETNHYDCSDLCRISWRLWL
jgi:hypothetical protein